LKAIKNGLSVILISFVLFMAIPLQASAYATNPIVETPSWINTSDITLSVTISKGTAGCSGYILGKPGTTLIIANFFLESRIGNNPFSNPFTWNGLYSPNGYLNFHDTVSVTSGYTYRLGCTVTVTRNGIDETVTVYSSEHTA